MKGLTDIAGIRVGHASDYEAMTGCTAILCGDGAVAGYDIRGSATGTCEFETMNPLHITDRVHAVVLAGGSAFGLEAGSGVRRYLAQQGIGFATRGGRVPIVPAAILYDLEMSKLGRRPGREMGESAAAAASDKPVEEGSVGAGTGATVGKVRGMKFAMKSGIGSATVALEGAYAGVRVAALVAVNAFGDVLEGGKVIAGTRRAESGIEFADSAAVVKRGVQSAFRENTTLAVVATDAQLGKVQATKLAQFASIGMVRAISPVNTMFDGDLVIALSKGDKRADLNALGVAAAEALERAIVRAVKMARSAAGLPGLAGS